MNQIEQKCKDLGLRYVGGVGPLNAKILLCGEALGAEEERLGEPFIGGAGYLLDSVLSISGIRRDSCYISNLVKVRPPKNDLARLGELGLTIEEFIPVLKEEIELVRPNVVCALGGHALEALTSHRGITNWRGSIIESSLVRGQKVIPTLHPSYIQRGQWKLKPLLVLDMKRVKGDAEFSELRLPQRTLVTEPSMLTVKEFLQTIRERRGYCASDIEIDSNGNITCLSLAPDPALSLSIPFRNGYGSYWTQMEEEQVWRWLRETFQTEGIRWIYQNFLFDCMWMIPKVGWFPLWMDTMYAHQLCYAEIEKGLDTLCSIYTRQPYYKDMRKVWKDNTITRQLWQYNALDSAVTVECALRLLEELRALKMEDFYFGFVNKLIQSVLPKLQMRGMKVDSEARSALREEMLSRKAVIEESIGSVNPRSSKQMQQLLYEEMGLPVQWQRNKKTGEMRPSTGKKALRTLRERMEE